MPRRLKVCAFTIDDDDQNNAHFCAFQFAPNSNGMVFIRLNESSCWPSLAHFRRYKTVITAMNDIGAANSTGEILFSKPVYYAHNNNLIPSHTSMQLIDLLTFWNRKWHIYSPLDTCTVSREGYLLIVECLATCLILGIVSPSTKSLLLVKRETRACMGIHCLARV